MARKRANDQLVAKDTESSPETPTKRQRNGGPGKLRGAVDGVPFGKNNQPTPEQKKAGWAKKRFARSVVSEMLNMPYKFAPDSQVKQQLIAAFGEQVLEMNCGEVMALMQMQKAVLKGDSVAFGTIMNQAFGMPKQEVETTEKKIRVTRK